HNFLQPRSAGINSGDGQRQDLNDADPGDTHTSIGGCVRADPNSGTESGGAGNGQRSTYDEHGEAFSERRKGKHHECGAKDESGRLGESHVRQEAWEPDAKTSFGGVEGHSESEPDFSWNKKPVNGGCDESSFREGRSSQTGQHRSQG